MQNNKEISIKEILDVIAKASECSPKETPDDLSLKARALISSISGEKWLRLEPEISGGGGGPGSMGMLIMRGRRQLAYTIKLRNITRDPPATALAIALGIYAKDYIPSVTNSSSLPLTFFAFLIGFTSALFKSFAHSIGYGEACLLHCMTMNAADGVNISKEEVLSFGPMLVEQYHYDKGANSNEIKSLLTSLKSWECIKERGENYIIQEEIIYYRDRPEYTN